MAILEIKNLTRRFGGLVAVNNLEFSTNAGEIVALIGSNGAGKTTAFSTISGFQKPDSGSIIFDNRDITGLPPHLIAERGLARSFQIVEIFADMTVLDAVTTAALLRLPLRQAVIHADEVIAQHDQFLPHHSGRLPDRRVGSDRHGLRLRNHGNDDALCHFRAGAAVPAARHSAEGIVRSGALRFLSSPIFWLVFAAAATMPLWLSPYYLGVATIALFYIGLALAWNIVAGIGGQMSLGHSVFVGVGGLLSRALLLKLGINMWLGMVIAAAISAAFGAFIAWLDFRFRLSQLSFALITLAFAEMGQLAAVGSEFLGGASGLFLPPDHGSLLNFRFGGHRGNFYLLFTASLVCLIANLVILNTSLGYYLRAMRDNENAAQAIGVALLHNKIIAMMMSAALTSIMGTAYARYSGFVDPYQFAARM